MGRKSRDKGKRGEGEVRGLFVMCMHNVESQLGVSHALSSQVKRNTLQSDRGGCDLVGIPGYAVEVKFCEQLRVADWWRQAVSQAGPEEHPLLVYRKSRMAWQVIYPDEWGQPVTTSFTDFLARYADLYKTYLVNIRQDSLKSRYVEPPRMQLQ